jgi:glutamine synthetase
VVESIRLLPWMERPTAQLMLQLNTEDGKPWGQDPRVVLKGVCERFEKMGLKPVCAPELEFYLLPEVRHEDGTPKIPVTHANGPCNIGGQIYSTEVMKEQAELLHEIRDVCEVMRIPLDGLVKELAPCQYEINLVHVDNPLLAADLAQLLKQVIKSVARRHKLIASFMAKPFGDRDGNGYHTHISLLDKNGNNVFDDGSQQGSEILRHAIAGLVASMADCMLIFAPHQNSYRRLRSGVHGPLVPSWGYENRYAAIRIPNGEGKARRIEHRIAGADTNPYLSLAALLAGIADGIENQMQADRPITGGPQNDEAILPGNWDLALTAFEASAFVADNLGENFQQAFAAIKRTEQAEFNQVVSPLEYNSYLVLA